MGKTIKIKCDPRLERHDHRALVPLQGSLKSLSTDAYNQLSGSITTHGFFAPIFVWEDDDKLMLIDGHQRQLVLNTLAGEGWTVPPVPIVRIPAENVQEAKEWLLLVTSQFGKVERDGLYEFLSTLSKPPQLVLAAVQLPHIDSPKFIAEYYDHLEERKQATGAQEISSSRFETFNTECPKCGFAFHAERKGK